MNMKKKILISLGLFCFVSFSFAQITVNPNDPFYTNVESWQMRKIIDNIPPLRPYPLSAIEQIIIQVIQNGDKRDVEIAKYYWEEITHKKWYLNLEGEVIAKVDESDNQNLNEDTLYELFPSVNGNLNFFNNFVNLGYKIGLVARTDTDELKFLPEYTNSMHDAIQDYSTLGKFYTYLDVNNVVSVGFPNLYFQTGIYRSGYGLFLNEGLALNDTAYHSANLSFTYFNSKFSYAQQLSAIGATKNYDSSYLSPDKFLAFHQLEYKFNPKFSFSYYETIVFGNRFDPSFIMPVPFAAAQSLSGSNDNLQMGLALKFEPMNGIMFSSDLFVDNLDVDNLLKLNFTTLNSFAAKLGLIYTPENSFCTRVDLNYTLVTPFTYSPYQFEDDGSISSSTINYQNYTNSGINIGTSYEPNSDAINFTLDFAPVPGLNLRLKSTFMRHGNIAETYSEDEAMFYLLADSGLYATDGTINTNTKLSSANSKTGENVNSAVSYLNFLKQRHIMYLIQSAFSGQYSFGKVKNIFNISLKFSYTFEYIHNFGIDSNIYPGGSVKSNTDSSGNVYYTIGADPTPYTNKSDVVSYFTNLWSSKLEDVVNNYFSVGLCLKF